MSSSIDFVKCAEILDRVAKDGREALLEHEGYEFLAAMGLNPPRWVFVPAGESVDTGLFSNVGAPLVGALEVIVKVVSPLVAHKTDVGGVRAVDGDAGSIAAEIAKMWQEVPKRIASLQKGARKGRPYTGRKISEKVARESILGFLISERLAFVNCFGGELLVGARANDAFGPVLVFGPGGVLSETWAKEIAAGRATAIRSAVDADKGSLSSMLDETLVGDVLMGRARGGERLAEPAAVLDVLSKFAKMAVHFSGFNKDAPHHLVEAEVNPFLVSGGELRPVDFILRFGPAAGNAEPMPPRPLEKVKKLLEPKSIAIVGVSEKGRNIGRIIFENLLGDGYPKGDIFIIKPGSTGSMEGCAVYDTVADLPEPVDLLAVAVEATRVPELVERVEKHGAAAGVLLIPGGMGEKDGSGTLESRITRAIRASRSQGRGAVYNGGNCIGIISNPGGYDTNFVPGYKLPRGGTSMTNTAVVSQSGAFIDSWLSKNSSSYPRYAVSIGNQIDITISDYLRAFRDDKGVEVVAVYVEGFRPTDGLATATEVSELVASGRDVVFYKAGRTSAGRASAAGHTASMAGDFAVAAKLLKQAGAWVADSFQEFENATKLLSFLHGREIRGRRVGAVSNAGFEVVGFADNIDGEPESLELPAFSEGTVARIEEIFGRARITEIMDVRNPIDATPMSDDACFADYVEAILSDPNIDLALVSVVPLTWLMNTLPKSEQVHSEDIEAPSSIARRLADIAARTDKPIVATVNAGRLYDPLVDMLEEASMPVIREADQAMRLMAKLVDVRAKRRTRAKS